jgi:phage N-6-adenine-methyltransferase
LNNVVFSSKSEEWATPGGILKALNDEFHFTCDIWATLENAKCPRFFTRADDGLSKSWDGERVFMNSPYGLQISKWIQKASRIK